MIKISIRLDDDTIDAIRTTIVIDTLLGKVFEENRSAGYGLTTTEGEDLSHALETKDQNGYITLTPEQLIIVIRVMDRSIRILRDKIRDFDSKWTHACIPTIPDKPSGNKK